MAVVQLVYVLDLSSVKLGWVKLGAKGRGRNWGSHHIGWIRFDRCYNRIQANYVSVGQAVMWLFYVRMRFKCGKCLNAGDKD